MSVYVSKDGNVSIAIGVQPKDALLFAPSKRSSAEILQEQREIWKKNNELIKARFAAATRR